MEPQEQQEYFKQHRRRVAVLLLFLGAVLLSYFAVMFNIQIVHGEEYRRRSASQIVRPTTVEASRGNITDRNGNLMVGNRSTYTLTFDASLLPKDADQNEAILRLLDLCRDKGIACTDNVPITADAPFAYLQAGDVTWNTFNRYVDSLRDRLDTQLEKRRKALADEDQRDNLKPSPYLDALLAEPSLDLSDLTAEQLMTAMRWDFEIAPEVSDADARRIVSVRYEIALRKIYATSAYVLAEDVDIDLITLIKDGDYYGAEIGTSSTREYATTAAAHVLGYVNKIGPEEYQELKDQGYTINDSVGRSGAESAFETYLHGVNGRRVVGINDEGKVTSALYQTEPQPGGTVELTIDLPLQEAVEQFLGDKVEELTAKDRIVRGGAVVVIEIGTGDVLALASYPTYDPASIRQLYNDYAADERKPMWNRATMGTYAPGSTFKPLTAVAALQEGVIDTKTKIRDTGRWYYPGDSRSGASCWYRAGHGPVNVTQAVTVSCNYYFAEMGYRLGMTRLNDYCAAFGLGESTGIEIGDTAGTLTVNDAGHDYAPWAAFGQADYLFTPVQLANYTATLAGGGKHYQAHLLKRVRSYDDSEILYEAKPELLNAIDIDPDNLDAVLTGMHSLAQTGSVSGYFRSCVVDAACKTGSAQIGQIKANGVFIAYAPYDDPQIAVAVVIEKADAGAYLAPVAVGILNAYFTEEDAGAVIAGENTLLG